MAQGLTEKLEYRDLVHTPDDCRRYELLDGRLYVTPSPRPLHQRVSKRLQRQLEAYFEDKGLGEVFNAPVDVILTLHDVVVPDLVVVTTPPQVTERAIEGSPTLVVEILSPTTRSRDRKLKAERYAALGVAHYWIVDPKRKTIECYRLQGTHYGPVIAAESPALMIHPDWPGMIIDLGAIWR
jgi:Uma2 family endonuclease